MEKMYKLLDGDGRDYLSKNLGLLGGNCRSKIYGRLDCSAANSNLDKGYANHRVFFANEQDAIDAGYRPCGSCLRDQYDQWKQSVTSILPSAAGDGIDLTPVTNEEGYQKALLAIRDNHHLRNTKYLEMLRAQYASPNHCITMGRLAKEVGFTNFNAANLQYGTMARLIAEALNYLPAYRTNDEPMWWSTLSTGTPASDTSLDGHFEIKMRPELIAALERMKWVRS